MFADGLTPIWHNGICKSRDYLSNDYRFQFASYLNCPSVDRQYCHRLPHWGLHKTIFCRRHFKRIFLNWNNYILIYIYNVNRYNCDYPQIGICLDDYLVPNRYLSLCVCFVNVFSDFTYSHWQFSCYIMISLSYVCVVYALKCEVSCSAGLVDGIVVAVGCGAVELMAFSACDNVTTWKLFPHHWPFVRGIQWSTLTKNQKRIALMFSLIVA